MVKRPVPPGQGWRTFLHNHALDIAAMDLFVVPTIGFNLLYAFVIVRLDRRDLVWIDVTANPMVEWIACRYRGHFLGTRLRTTSSAIATGSMAASSRADCAPGASGTSRAAKRHASAGRGSSSSSPASFRQSEQYTRCLVIAPTPEPEGGARCVSARWNPCGGEEKSSSLSRPLAN
jgi:hypothetical protein